MDEALAELAVRTRRTTSAPGELAQALVTGEVVKAFAFRGAVHYLSPEEGGAYLALRAAGRQWERRSWVEYYGLTAEAWTDFRAAVRTALQDGPLTVTELGDALTRQREYRHLAPVFDEGAYTLVKPLTWQGDMSIAPSRDGRLTFQRLDSNPRWGGIPDLDDAGPRAIRAYLRTYGPATRDHLRYWLVDGLSAGRKRVDDWFTGLADEVAAVDVEGTAAFSCARTSTPSWPRAPPTPCASSRATTSGSSGPGTKDVHVTPPSRRELMTRKANPVVAAGVVRGTWARKGEELTVSWLDDAPRPDAALEEEAHRLAGLLGVDLHLTLEP